VRTMIIDGTEGSSVKFKISPAAKKALMLGSMCSLSYLAVYIARNILGAVSPQMEAGGAFTKESIGMLSSIYFTCYAVGQLINGMIGEKIKSKYMISFGLILAGVCNFLLPQLSGSLLATYASYGATGFFLSMIYAPMTKVVAENAEPIYATRCSLGYTFASFFGSPLAGVLAAVMTWQLVFFTSSGVLIAMGVICFIVFTVFEKKGFIKYGQYKPAKNTNNIGVLIKHRIIRFTLIAVLTGIVRTSVVFWLTTYFSEYLGYAPDMAAVIFTVATFIISASAFVAVFIYERLGRDMDKTILIAFSVSAVSFLLVFFIKQPFVNVGLIVLAILANNCAASMLWSRYCPSLRDTGMVSSATGFLDFMGYMAASVSSSLFANAVGSLGWGNLILIWAGLMGLGVIVAVPFKKTKKQTV